MIKNLKEISEILDISSVKIKKIKKDININNFKWDSLAFINLITIYNSKFKKNLDMKKIIKIKSIFELDRLLDKPK